MFKNSFSSSVWFSHAFIQKFHTLILNPYKNNTFLFSIFISLSSIFISGLLLLFFTIAILDKNKPTDGYVKVGSLTSYVRTLKQTCSIIIST